MRHITIEDVEPNVSIIVPAYNAEKFIGQTLDSLIKQVYKDIEIIVVNDGSTDNTSGIVKKFFFDRRIRYFEKENGGTGTALNYGHHQARGKLLTWCSADNLYLFDFVSTLAGALQHFNNQDMPVEFVYSDFCFIDAQGRKLKDEIHKVVQPKHDLVNGYDIGMSFMYTKELWEDTGPYWNKICEDFNWVVRAAQHTNFALVNKVLAGFRVHGDQISGNNKEEEQVAADECKSLALQYLKEGKYGPPVEILERDFNPQLVATDD